MRERKLSIFSRISALVFTLITLICLLFTAITYLSTSNYHEASTQLLNKDVAAHIAEFTSPFKNGGINKKKADSVFYNAMVLSPGAEVYFLDTTGRVIAYHANTATIRQWVLPLVNIKRLIASLGKEYIKGPDPREPENQKIFSAAEVLDGAKKLGYIYVILSSNKNITQMLYKSYFNGLIVKVFIVIIILSIIFSFFYVTRFQKSFNQMLVILEKFQNGDFEARFPASKHRELEPVTTAFNKMADLLVYNLDRITKSEKERKDFIANISHDLRTPLAIARGYTETLIIKKEKLVSPQEQEEFLQLVHRKILQVEQMVKQLFELSKMESVEFFPKKEPFIFSEILLEIIHESLPAAKEKNIHFDYTQSKDASWIFADVGMLERVIQNFVVNAIKYTPENGSIKVILAKEGEILTFSIQNSGLLLSEQMVNWFNNYDKKNLLSNRPSGAGFGLAIVKKILQIHEYNAQVIADQNNTNTFTVHMASLGPEQSSHHIS